MSLFLALIMGLAVTLAAGLHWGGLTACLVYLGLEHWRLQRRVAELEARLQKGLDYLPDLVNQLWDIRQQSSTASASANDVGE